MVRLLTTIFALLGFTGMAFATHDGVPGDNKGWATETETTSTQGSSGKPANEKANPNNEGTTDTSTTTSSPPGNPDSQHGQSESETSGPGKSE